MNDYTVIIPSNKMENLTLSIGSIKQHQPNTKIIVVYDASQPLPSIEGVQVIAGELPFCVARNINIGIKAAPITDDVILWNDDAILKTANGLDALQQAAQNYGMVSPVILGRVANPNQMQNRRMSAHRSEPERLVMMVVYITRQTLNTVGLLDEQYEHGCFEDDDFSYRCKFAGIPLGVTENCIADHSLKTNSIEKEPKYKQFFEANKKRYQDKYKPTRIVLSICIASIYSRNHYLARLMAVLQPQLCNGVELLMDIDGGAASVGTKRQRLLEAARGQYVVSIDDDDLIHPQYIHQILLAIYKNTADVIGFNSKRWCDDVFDANCTYSIRYQKPGGHSTINGVKHFERGPYHITPIKREIALKAGFADMDFGEDTVFAEQVRQHIQTEEFIDDYLYFYYWRSDRKAEQTHKKLTGGR